MNPTPSPAPEAPELLPCHRTKCPDAYRLDLSPHEWTWTDSEQVEMARAIRSYDRDIVKAAPLLRELLKHSKRSCHTERLAAQILQIFGL